MPTTKTIKLYCRDGTTKSIEIRDFVPQRIQDEISRNSGSEGESSVEKGIKLNHYLLMNMVISPKITEEMLNSDDSDSFENEQILDEIMKMAGIYINPADVIGKPKEELQKMVVAERQKRIDDLKKKPTKQ